MESNKLFFENQVMYPSPKISCSLRFWERIGEGLHRRTTPKVFAHSRELRHNTTPAERTAFLESKGYQVLRFWNNEVQNDLDGVMNVILEKFNHPPS